MTRKPPPRRGWDHEWAAEWLERLRRAASEERAQGFASGSATVREHDYWSTVVGLLTAAQAAALAARKWREGRAEVTECDVEMLASLLEATADAHQGPGEDPYEPVQGLLFSKRGTA